jgi:hypothetical protein
MLVTTVHVSLATFWAVPPKADHNVAIPFFSNVGQVRVLTFFHV